MRAPGSLQTARVGSAAVPITVTPLTTGLSVPRGLGRLPDGSQALVTEWDDFRVWKAMPSGQMTQVGMVPNTRPRAARAA